MKGLNALLSAVVVATVIVRARAFSGSPALSPLARLIRHKSVALASTSSTTVAAGLQERLISGSKLKKSEEELASISLGKVWCFFFCATL